MTDKQHDTQKAAGEIQGAPDGDKGGEGERANGRTSHGTHGRQEQERRTSGGKGGREEERGWPRAWRAEEGNGEEHGSREGTERTDRQS